MKFSRLYKALIILVMIFCSNYIIAQNMKSTAIPASVINALITKYPKAEAKNWQIADNEYTAKIKEDHKKYFVSFDKNGTWLKTTQKYNWPGHLTPAVQKAFKKSEYGNWHIYGINIIETPRGKFYQVMVDDANQVTDPTYHQVVEQNKVLEYKSNGDLINLDATFAKNSFD